MVTSQHVTVGTDKGQAPGGAGNGLIADETRLVIDVDGHAAFLAGSHLIA